MTVKSDIESYKSSTLREVLRAAHLPEHLPGKLPLIQEAAWRTIVSITERLPKKEQNLFWQATWTLLAGAAELRDMGADCPKSPPSHIWSVRMAIREGARTIEEASQMTGLPTYAITFAWDYARNHPSPEQTADPTTHVCEWRECEDGGYVCIGCNNVAK